MGKCSIFGVNLDFTPSDKQQNVLQVEDYKEIDFDIYQCTINGEHIIAEKIGVYNDFPVIQFKTTINNTIYDCEAILTKNSDVKFFLNENALRFYREIIPSVKPAIVTEKAEQIIPKNTIYEKELTDTANELLKQYEENATKIYKNKIEEYKKNKQKIINELRQYFETKTNDVKGQFGEQFMEYVEKNDVNVRNLLNENKKEFLENIKQSKEEFLTNIKKLKDETFSSISKNAEISNKALTENASLITEFSETLNERLDIIENRVDININNNKTFTNKIEDRVDNIITVVDESQKTVNDNKKLFEQYNSKLNERVESFEDKLNIVINDNSIHAKELREQFQSTIDENKKLFEQYNNKLNERSKIFEDRLNTVINDSTIRANRLKERLEKREKALFKAVNEKFTKQNEQILEVIDNKIDFVNDESKNEFKHYINAQIEEIENLYNEYKFQLNERIDDFIISLTNKNKEEYKVILSEKVNNIDLEKIKNEVLKKVQSDYKNEISSLKRYAELVSGGGSVAMQFANGGYMDGNLTVNGVISGLDVIGGEYIFTGGTVNGDLTVLGTLSASLIEATSASFEIIDIKQYELSGFNVTGNTSISGNLSVDGTFINNDLIYPIADGNPYDVLTTDGNNNLSFQPINSVSVITTLPYTAVNSGTFTYIVSSNETTSFTLPPVSAYSNRILNIKKVGSGILTVSGYNGELIDKQVQEELIDLDNITLQGADNEWFIMNIYGPVIGV